MARSVATNANLPKLLPGTMTVQVSDAQAPSAVSMVTTRIMTVAASDAAAPPSVVVADTTA